MSRYMIAAVQEALRGIESGDRAGSQKGEETPCGGRVSRWSHWYIAQADAVWVPIDLTRRPVRAAIRWMDSVVNRFR